MFLLCVFCYDFYVIIIGTASISNIRLFSKPLQFSLCSPRKPHKSCLLKIFFTLEEIARFQSLIFYEYFHVAQIFWDRIHCFSCSSYINTTVYSFCASTVYSNLSKLLVKCWSTSYIADLSTSDSHPVTVTVCSRWTAQRLPGADSHHPALK